MLIRVGGVFLGCNFRFPNTGNFLIWMLRVKLVYFNFTCMKTIVTGGAGFLGSHLCDLLLENGHEVICIDNLVTGSAKNIEHIKSDRFTYLKHDITKPIYFGDRIDYIFHLASPASPIDYLDLPIQTLKVGALGTYNMLGLAKEQGARFLLASTSEIYGDPLVNPQPKSYRGNMNPIGPRMRAGDGRVVPNFINQALRGEDITVYGDGSQTRSFCYVSDLIDGIYRLMMSDFVKPVNVGNPDEMSVLGWEPEVRLDGGLRETVGYFENLKL